MKVAALIIGIDGWDRYTFPLVESISEHEPDCQIVVIDNASATPYPAMDYVYPTRRMCYSAAINLAASSAGKADWYIVLSNDVLCTGPFVEMLTSVGAGSIVGPCLKHVEGFAYLEGWCVCAPTGIWNELRGWDEQYKVSSWEDVDFSTRTLENGYNVALYDLPFRHLDQRQRFGLVPDYWDSENHNIRYFMQQHRQPVTA